MEALVFSFVKRSRATLLCVPSRFSCNDGAFWRETVRRCGSFWKIKKSILLPPSFLREVKFIDQWRDCNLFVYAAAFW